jgi:hypothetical protein
MDNLIAEGKAQPFIIAMEYGGNPFASGRTADECRADGSGRLRRIVRWPVREDALSTSAHSRRC